MASLPSLAGSKQLLVARDQINSLFTNLNAEADAVVFESGPQRASHLQARTHIRAWLACLRTLYLLELPHLDSDRPDSLAAQMLTEVSRSLTSIADCLEHQLAHPSNEAQLALAISTETRELPPALALIRGMAKQLERNVTQQPVFLPSLRTVSETWNTPVSNTQVQ